jgi:hypothetical protein
VALLPEVMHLLAASDFGDYLFLAIMLVFGLINWVATKLKEGKTPPQQQRPARPAARPVEAPSADAEAERMRRFLEALGVPSDEPERPAPPPPAPRPVPRPAPAMTRTAPPPPPPLPVERSLDEADTTTEPVEHIRLPELQTAPMREFETVSSRVSADEDGDFVTVAGAISAVPACPREHPELATSSAPARRVYTSSILAKLCDRNDVRTALILSEILGPPRSLRR